MVRLKGLLYCVSALVMAFTIITVVGCTKSTGLGSLPPIAPVTEIPPELAEDIVIDRETDPPSVEVTKDNITVVGQYIRTYELNRKLNRGSMTSPFFFREAWHQGDKTDVFFVKITNNRQKPILFDIHDCHLRDDTGGEYVGLSHEENAERLLYKTGRDIKINNGLEYAQQILLETQIQDGEIKPGQTVEGYLPFLQVTSRAKRVDLIIDLDEAPDTEIGRYQTVEFVLPFKHDLAIRNAQPAVVSF